MSGHHVWSDLVHDLMYKSTAINARGIECREIENRVVEFKPYIDRFCLFDDRDLNFKYIAGEFAWYLRGNRYDTSIEEYSKFWAKLKNEVGPTYNSNYGWPIFKQKQFEYCMSQLLMDRDTRQACIVINDPQVMMSNSKDKICTNAIMFRIREDKLNMSVQMRSNDVILGLCIDAPIFSFIHEMMYVMLREEYHDLELGNYHHISASMHIYDRHYGMGASIACSKGKHHILMPVIENSEEVWYLLNQYHEDEVKIRHQTPGWENITTQWAFSSFLLDCLKGIPVRKIYTK